MSTEMKTGLALSGDRTVGVYQAGVIRALTEYGTRVSMVLRASTGVLDGATIVASPGLSKAAMHLETLWDYLGSNQVLPVNRLAYFSLLKKLFQAMNLCRTPGRVEAPFTALLRRIPIFSGFDNLTT